jgi:hypothetical protein
LEGRRFACGWKKQDAVYHVWVNRRPKLAAKAKTFNQADRRLWAAIIDATGDGESIREYDPPAPDSETALLEVRPADMSAWVTRLRKHARARSKREPLTTNAQVQRKFAQRVEEHFSFLRGLRFTGPALSREDNPQTGRSFRARFASPKRTLDIDLDRAHAEYANGATFSISPVPVVDQLESFMSVMYFELKHRQLGHRLAEFEATHTLDEIMQLTFPLFADLFRGELRPVLIGEQWHDEYNFYRD